MSDTEKDFAVDEKVRYTLGALKGVATVLGKKDNMYIIRLDSPLALQQVVHAPVSALEKLAQ